MCSVRDTGMGIAAEDHSKVFKSYSQATSYTSRKFGGTGLGLAICKVNTAVGCTTQSVALTMRMRVCPHHYQALVGAMKGKVGLQSKVGVGSTFSFTIPLHKVRACVAATPLARNFGCR